MSALRIALVSPYALSVPGGVQGQALAMSRELARRGHEVLLVAPDRDDPGPHDTPARVVTLGRLLRVPANGSRAPITLTPGAARAARDVVDAFGPRVCHVHEPFAPILGYRTVLAHRAPIVATFHRSGLGPAYSLTRPWLVRLARQIDVAVAVSAAARATALDGAGVESEVLFNGLETESFRREPRTRGETPTVFFVGRLEERKGARSLCEAARILASRGRPFEVVVMGDGPQRAELEGEFGADVRFLGTGSEPDKRRWLRRADVVVAASLRGESFGVVLLEAMAAEVPVVASDIDGYREAAGGLAELFSPGDPSSLADAIERALIAPSGRVAAARARAETWSMSALVERYLERYDEASRRFAARG